jgi:hypothetical protein
LFEEFIISPLFLTNSSLDNTNRERSNEWEHEALLQFFVRSGTSYTIECDEDVTNHGEGQVFLVVIIDLEQSNL